MNTDPVEVVHPARRRRVVIIGAGFGGLMAAKTLKGAAADMTVDRPA